VLKPVATCACLGSGAPGGLFTPTLCVGALMGGVLGHVWALAGLGQAGAPFALIGAAAVLAASTQGPVSALVLIVELTHHVDTLIVPLLLAIAGATVVARALQPRSIYSGRIHAGREVAEGAGLISAAAGYLEVLQKLLFSKTPPVLQVLTQNGAVVGEIALSDVTAIGERLPLTEIATAHDLARCRGARQPSAE
jgi:CIC family chloride channel protein